jgi:hypothetical protein
MSRTRIPGNALVALILFTAGCDAGGSRMAEAQEAAARAQDEV